MDVGFYDDRPNIKWNNSARTKDAVEYIQIVVEKLLNPPLALPPVENDEESDNLERQGMKVINPSNILDLWTRLEVSLGLKPSGQTDTLTEASHLAKKFYKKANTKWTAISEYFWQIAY